MLSNFTWWQFFGTFLLSAFIYYSLVLWLYFRKEVRQTWNRFFFQYSDSPSTYALVEEEEMQHASIPSSEPLPLSDVEATTMITHLKADVQNGVKAAKDSHASKDQLLALLKNILLKYPQLKKSAQRVEINEFILQECAAAGYIIQMALVYALWANATAPNE